MAIDHGLQGRNNEKSKRRREKRSMKIKQIARGALTKKKEVFFDEASRVDFLSGFRQRKQERRQFGLAMQILKNKKNIKEKSKERKQVLKSTVTESVEEQSDDDIATDEVPALYDDSVTTEMFGAPVSVTIDDSNISRELEEFKNPDLFNSHKETPMSRRDVRELELQKAMKIAKRSMNEKKPSKKKLKDHKGNIEKKQKKSGKKKKFSKVSK
jgi:hypothetical protein